MGLFMFFVSCMWAAALYPNIRNPKKKKKRRVNASFATTLFTLKLKKELWLPSQINGIA